MEDVSFGQCNFHLDTVGIHNMSEYQGCQIVEVSCTYGID